MYCIAICNCAVSDEEDYPILVVQVLELAVTMLACARIGALHSVVFAGFSADSLASRMVDAKLVL